MPEGAHVLIFYGATQVKLRKRVEFQVGAREPALAWIKISGQGPNALDFHIAFYLGRILAGNPKVECAILSRDNGFDPLVRHLGTLGCECRRVTELVEAFPRDRKLLCEDYGRLMRLLRKEKRRPVRREGLAGKVKSWFPQMHEDARLTLIQRLFDEAGVREAGNRLIYEI